MLHTKEDLWDEEVVYRAYRACDLGSVPEFPEALVECWRSL